MSHPPTGRFLLRDLTFPARIVLSAFLLSVGIGYVSAVVNLHFQEASPGKLLPDRDDVITSYHGKTNVCQMQRLLTAHESLPFNGQGSMRSAFTRTRAGGIDQAINARAKKDNTDPNDLQLRARYEVEVLREMNGERLALLAWVNAGFPRAAYEDDKGFLLTGALADPKEVPISERFVNTVQKEDKVERYARVKAIIDSRCARCHAADANGPGGQYPLQTYAEVAAYCRQPAPSGKSITKLALTTHVHLLGFSMLYGLTGLILAFTRLPMLIRLVLCPLPLVAQVADISCWWLARLDGTNGEWFASIIPLTGGVVALGLVLQIVLSVFDMYDWTGRLVLVLLFVGAGAAGGLVFNQVVKPWLEREQGGMVETPAETPTETKPEEKPDEKRPDAKQPGGKQPDVKPVDKAPPSQMERLLEDEPRKAKANGKEFNGKGQMSTAFVNQKWEKAVAAFQKEHGDLTTEAAEEALYQQRDGERLALLAWLKAGAPEEAYEKDAFGLPADGKERPLTPEFRTDDGKVRIKSILDTRCVRCHGPGEAQADWPLDTYANMKKYLPAKVAGREAPVNPTAKPPVVAPGDPGRKPDEQPPMNAVPPPPMQRVPRRRSRRAG